MGVRQSLASVNNPKRPDSNPNGDCGTGIASVPKSPPGIRSAAYTYELYQAGGRTKSGITKKL